MKKNFISKMKTQNPIILFITKEIIESETLPDGQVIIPKHAYSFVSYTPSTGIIELRNPHGKNHLKINLETFKIYFASVRFL